MILSSPFFTFLVYVMFKVVFDFILPIYRTTKKVKQSFRDMQQKMNEGQPNAGYAASENGAAKNEKEPLGDYIDYEEVKD